MAARGGQKGEHGREHERQQREHERLKLNIEKAKLDFDNRRQDHREAFDVNKCFSLVPRFDPEKVELFFEMFEKIAKQRSWPEEEWATLIQGSLTGKAQELLLL